MLRRAVWSRGLGARLAVAGIVFSGLIGGCARTPGANGLPDDLAALELRAERGNLSAADALGQAYATGTKTPQDFAEARKWFQLASDHGDPAGEFNLGLLYLNGKGAPIDTDQAVRWIRDSADHGYSPAKAQLGVLYFDGKGVGQDDAEGTRWLRAAAIDGLALAQLLLAVVYTSGRGVEPDDGIAYEWASLAAVRMPPATQTGVSKIRDAMAKDLPPDVLAAAQSAATQWKPGDDLVSPFPPGSGPRPARVRGQGSGFIIGKNGEVATDYHVVPNCSEIRVKDSAGKFDTVSRLIAGDKTVDLALLRGGGFGVPLKLRSGEPSLGESVVTFGFPLGQVLSGAGNLTDGSVSSATGMQGDEKSFQITAPVQPGSSGGPVVDQGGAVIGVVLSKLNALAVAIATNDIAQNVNFATRARLLRTLMDSSGVAYESTGTGEPRSNTELAELLQKSTVKVECWR